MIPQSLFFNEAHNLCGSKTCSIRNIVKSQPQTNYYEALGIETDIKNNDDIFAGDYIASVMPTTITRSTGKGTLEMVKGWHVVIEIPDGKYINATSRITLENDTEERIVLKWIRSLQGNIYATVLS